MQPGDATETKSIDRLRRALDEYEVGGIQTTLPFFREIVRDEEFKSGKLDTGFIGRFNERRAVKEDKSSSEEVLPDMAVIAAAIHHAKLQRAASFNSRPAETENRWKMSSRVALQEARDANNVGRKQKHSNGPVARPSRRAVDKPASRSLTIGLLPQRSRLTNMKLKAQLSGKEYDLSLSLADGAAVVAVDDRRYGLQVRELASGEYLLIDGSTIYKCLVSGRGGSGAAGQAFAVVLRGRNYEVGDG